MRSSFSASLSEAQSVEGVGVAAGVAAAVAGVAVAIAGAASPPPFGSR